MTDTYHEVLFSEIAGKEGDLGLITLNRPQVLNSLNHTMIQAMYTHLSAWAKASHIKGVIITAAEGRAFCAGGDLRSTYDRRQAEDHKLKHFFHEEYQLNRLIFHFPKPYIALLDGITMGGGVGISIHGSHRVATDRLLFAMPETGIGFFPDVGGTYFLPRLTGQIGFYLGLSGARLNSDDCVALGIAQQKVAREALAAMIEALAHHPFGERPKESVTQVIAQFQVLTAPLSFSAEQAEIDHCFDAATMEEIIERLQQSSQSIAKEALLSLAKKSPTSLKIRDDNES